MHYLLKHQQKQMIMLINYLLLCVNKLWVIDNRFHKIKIIIYSKINKQIEMEDVVEI